MPCVRLLGYGAWFSCLVLFVLKATQFVVLYCKTVKRFKKNMAHGPRRRLPSQLTNTKFGTVQRAAHTKSVY